MRLKSSFRVLLTTFIVLALVACSSGQRGASKEQLSNALAVDLPSGLEVREIEIVATESVGSDANPRFRTRFDATLGFTQDFFRRKAQLDGRPLVEVVGQDGDTLSGTIIATSTLRDDNNWRIGFDFTEFPPLRGESANQFAGINYVVEGSDEYEAIRARLAQEAAEAERKRAEAEAAAEAARQQRVSQLRETLDGTWRSSAPLTRDGSVYQHRGFQTGFELDLARAQGLVGRGTGKMYVFSEPNRSVNTGVGYVIDEDGEFATVTFNDDAYHRDLRTDAGRNMTWRFFQDGRLVAEKGGEVWVAQLSKQ